jgi:hypothetical protein
MSSTLDLSALGSLPAGGNEGDVLVKNAVGSEWAPPPSGGGATTLDALTDVAVPTPVFGEVLTFTDLGDGDSAWTPGPSGVLVEHTLDTTPGYGITPAAIVNDYAALDTDMASRFPGDWVQVSGGDSGMGVELFCKMADNSVIGPFGDWIKNPKYVLGANNEDVLIVPNMQTIANAATNAKLSSRHWGDIVDNGGDVDTLSNLWRATRTAVMVPLFVRDNGAIKKIRIISQTTVTERPVGVHGSISEGGDINQVLESLYGDVGTTIVIRGGTSAQVYSVFGGEGYDTFVEPHESVGGLPSLRGTGDSGKYTSLVIDGNLDTGILEWVAATPALTAFSTVDATAGVVPGSSGATTAFLRGDGTWATPSGGTTYTTKTSRYLVTETAHGRAVGDWAVYYGGPASLFDVFTNYQIQEHDIPIGVISQVIDADTYVVTTNGYVTGLPSTAVTSFFPGWTVGTQIDSTAVGAGPISLDDFMTNASFMVPKLDKDTATSGTVYESYNATIAKRAYCMELNGPEYATVDIRDYLNVDWKPAIASDPYRPAMYIVVGKIDKGFDSYMFAVRPIDDVSLVAMLGLNGSQPAATAEPNNTIFYLSDTSAGKVTSTKPENAQALCIALEGEVIPFFNTPGYEAAAPASGGGASTAVSQTTHGFVVGEVLKRTAGAYAKAQANTAANAEVVGMVSAVADVNNFTLTHAGKVSGLTGLTDGSAYFLSAATAGAITATEPTTGVSKPVLVAVSTTEGIFMIQRGIILT